MTDEQVSEWWKKIDEAAEGAPTAPYSHSKVVELMRAHRKIIVALENRIKDLEAWQVLIRDQSEKVDREHREQLKEANFGPFEVFVKCEECEHITKAQFQKEKGVVA